MLLIIYDFFFLLCLILFVILFQVHPHNRKRRIPGSVIGSVIHHSSGEEEEEYDPYNPSYGSVASVVRVTERKLV